MQALKSVKSLELVNLAQLSGLTLGTSGVTKATSIKIQDTFISDLSGLNVATADNITIANNGRLTMFNAKLENVTYTLSVVDNAGGMQINMSRLESAGVLDFRSIKSFDAPLLQTANRLSFQESPDLLSVSANNLTSIKDSLTLDNNKKLANISFTSLEKISGDMTIRNNTALLKINKFPQLKTIGGAVLLAGSFDTYVHFFFFFLGITVRFCGLCSNCVLSDSVEIPKLNDIKGAVTVTSTTDISSFCSFFDDLKKNNAIQGKESCTSNNAKANEGGKGGTSGSGNNTDSAATGLGVNHAVLGFAAVAGFAQLF